MEDLKGHARADRPLEDVVHGPKRADLCLPGAERTAQIVRRRHGGHGRVTVEAEQAALLLEPHREDLCHALLVRATVA
eukprot:6402686-Prymnesium_polylepis.1